MKNRNRQKGFTLIELLAVIIILAVILLIAIPSVTSSINSSRKKTFVDNAKAVIQNAIVDINSGNYPLYDVDATYYIPASCFATETGGERSSFGGTWDKEYVVVTYTGDGFDYYYTAVDSNKKGIYLAYSNLLDEKIVRSGIEEIPLNVGVGERQKLVIFDEESCSTGEEPEATTVVNTIIDRTYYDPKIGFSTFLMLNECTLGGKNGVITNCGVYNGKKYIDTGVKPYTIENIHKDYEISFDVIEFNPNDQAGETQATLMACKQESGNYPGFVIRKSNNNLDLRHRFKDSNVGKTFAASSTTAVKITRKNNVVYFSYNNKPLEKLQDITGFTDYFDHSILIGAAHDSNGQPFRYGKFKIANLVAKMNGYSGDEMEKNLHTVYSLNTCTFNGTSGTITNCGSYNGRQYVDTGISLFGTETYKKDFMISFNVNSISDTQDPADDDQPTLLSNKLETGTYPGLVYRLYNNSNMKLDLRLNNNRVERSLSTSKIKQVRIYRKGGVFYYAFNDELVSKLQDGQNFNEFFNDTLWLGAAKDADGNPFRHIKASISNFIIKTS